MGQALYRKYRSKKLSEIVGQEHITTALDNALKKGLISHAYLLTGPRGVGKTSIARILAYEINGLPYDDDASHLDIIEIDAASNRRIDEIRELRDRIHSAPASAKFKVYIIDEVHMLTREAFNALLKTLEEPPAHAIFILATTEAHKLPETIVSRTQRYNFKPIDRPKIIDHLRMIANQENITVDDDALELIAEHGDGSFRDSIGLLDQIRNTSDHVKLGSVQQSLGIAPAEAIQKLIEALQSHDSRAVVETLKSMQLQGLHAPMIAKQLSEYLRSQLLLDDQNIPVSLTSKLLRELLQVPASPNSTGLLEIVLLEATIRNGKKHAKQVSKVEEVATAPAKPTKESKPDQKKEVTIEPEPVKPIKSEPKPSVELDEKSWSAVLQAIKARHNTLYSVARMAIPSFDGDNLTLTFSFPFHQKRLDDAKNKQIISDVIRQSTGQGVSITCAVDINARAKPTPAVATTSPLTTTISNIFGGGEVVD